MGNSEQGNTGIVPEPIKLAVSEVAVYLPNFHMLPNFVAHPAEDSGKRDQVQVPHRPNRPARWL